MKDMKSVSLFTLLYRCSVPSLHVLMFCSPCSFPPAARHLADYVLIWGGGGGDDLGKCLWCSFVPLQLFDSRGLTNL